MRNARQTKTQPSAERLTQRLTLLAVGMVIAVSALYGAYHVLTTRADALRAEERELAQRAQFYAEQISGVFEAMETDGTILANYPPIRGIERSLAAPDGIDPEDASTLTQWENRLATLFSNKLEARPHYVQLRLILAADGWREAVRVDGRNGKVTRVPDSELQRKGGEPYLARLKTDAGSAPYFSRVTYNRERGKRDGGPVTIRLIHPLHDAEGRLLGAIVINADYEELLKSVRPEVLPDQKIAVVNSEGDYLLYELGQRNPRLFHHTDPDYVPLPHAEALGSELGRNGFAQIDDKTAYLHVVPFASHQPLSVQFGVLTFGTSTPITGAIAGLVIRHTLMTVLLSLFAGAVTQFLAAELSQRFEDLSAEVAKSHERLEWTVRNVADGLITISGDGHIEDINPEAEKMFGYSAQELKGQPLTVLMFEDIAARHQSHVAASRVGSTGVRMAGNREIHGRHKSGRSLPIEISVSRAELDGEIKFIGLVRDISVRRAAEDRVNALVEALRRSNEELDQFAYVASHDLKAPLRVIQNAAGWLADDLEPHLTEDTRESLELLQSRALRMEGLLNDLLEHSRIGRTAQSKETVPGHVFIEELRGLLLIPEGMRLEVEGPWDGVTLPRMPLQLVVTNLVSNAFKHHDRSEGTVRLTMVPRPSAWEITVEDDGPGIAPEFHENVFQIFQTLRPRDEVEGSGMGLAMVRKHVEVVGGEIELQSDGTRGTLFRLIWPHPIDTHDREIAA
ncbi:sensor histidine kinase [Vannielia litorea]|uniref:sensor histidine kinase n=1 Tax=Vannielia litorea TaxID=1217970 RepID=UPI001BCC80A4|nr:ATP-binding protein [Vannielia litorea]MBS8226977.1 PAS domain S-box protein [Vannielia litorea]